jgi:hypothetical protein
MVLRRIIQVRQRKAKDNIRQLQQDLEEQRAISRTWNAIGSFLVYGIMHSGTNREGFMPMTASNVSGHMRITPQHVMLCLCDSITPASGWNVNQHSLLFASHVYAKRHLLYPALLYTYRQILPSLPRRKKINSQKAGFLV